MPTGRTLLGSVALCLVMTWFTPAGALSSSARADWTVESNREDAQFGISVGTAGDVDGDGFVDVIVGAAYFQDDRPNEGWAFVYHGSSSGISTTPRWITDGDQRHANHGATVGTAGDVNGDGFDDVIVGAPSYDHGESDEGRAVVYEGSASGLTTASWSAEGDQIGAHFGESVDTAGDVNGDGYEDVIVGAPFYRGGLLGYGRAFVFEGSASGLSTTPSWTADGEQEFTQFGESVGAAGDVNGDGYDDVIVGDLWYENGESAEGAAFLYHGSAAGLATTPSWIGEGNQQSAFFGESVGGAGDVNGDGYDDAIVGATLYDNGEASEGRAFVYHGSASGLATTPSWTGESNQETAFFGESVGTAGDVNGDGFDDVIVGATGYDNGQTAEGATYLYRGSASGLGIRARISEGDQAYANFGVSAGTAGDVNGDGLDDLITGASQYDHGEDDEGVAFAVYGRT
jgi:hypothetical protein